MLYKARTRVNMKAVQRHNHTPLLHIHGHTQIHKKGRYTKTHKHSIPLKPLRVTLAQFVLSSLITLIAADVE